jgi:hypothetical protein
MACPIKIFVITYSNLFTQKARDFLTGHGIQLVSIGNFITDLYQNFKSVCYYSLKNNIFKVIKNITKSNPAKNKFFGVSSIVNYFVVNTVTTDTDNYNYLTIETTNKINYDTPINSSVNSSNIVNKLKQLAIKNINQCFFK